MNHIKFVLFEFVREKTMLMFDRDKKLKNSHIKLKLNNNVYHLRYYYHIKINLLFITIMYTNSLNIKKTLSQTMNLFSLTTNFE